MNINDRGMKKWHGFMMPEHVEGIKEMWIDSQKNKMPIWDEEQIAEFEQLIRYAKDYNLYVDLSIYNNGFERNITCSIKSIDPLKKEIKIATVEGMESIRFDKILNITVID
ncbi:hypothetical protein B5V89_16360 [Heyndrickxia sporothermodurans]|uniref:YolD-like family protein n=1 Tax=Heyndrickxia sporothermodurans TaxID=46224 RepID=UPI000D3B291D|nr:YolD-like family protein [Heyndrickxia sporothermodurans]PTY76973.1 hypothetical protein B5V89_16360 [Heyndrickxia sporothermodurans]